MRKEGEYKLGQAYQTTLIESGYRHKGMAIYTISLIEMIFADNNFLFFEEVNTPMD